MGVGFYDKTKCFLYFCFKYFTFASVLSSPAQCTNVVFAEGARKEKPMIAQL
jgi:hypothetical protein